MAPLQADPTLLTDRPHPDAWRTDKTLRGEACRLIRGTVAERTRTFRGIEAALAERDAAPFTRLCPTDAQAHPPPHESESRRSPPAPQR